jgi:CSLREA domain-containing protein
MKRLFGIVVLAFLLTPANAMAANLFVVNTTADNTTVDGLCTLREATGASNSGPTADCPTLGSPSVNTINFAGTLGPNPLINLNVGNQLLLNTNNVAIVGPATVNNVSAGFRVLAITGGINTTLGAMTISGGNETSTGAGGGINLTGGGTLTLNNSVVSGNKTSLTGAGVSTFGGGIFANGNVTLNSSAVTSNQAISTQTSGTGAAAGGGIQISGTLGIHNSQVSGNQALNTSAATGAVEADGGGIRSGGNVSIDHSTISGNLGSATASGTASPTVQGGGWLILGTTPTINVELSTIANNRMKATAPISAPVQRGGGIYSATDSTDTYVSSTIAGNGLDPASSTVGTVVGMNFRSDNPGTRAFSNTIIANPVGSVGTNCSGDTPYVTGGTPNVDFPQDGTFPCFTPGPTIMNVNPQLGPLGSNGGLTSTMVPAPTSPVIDQGTNTDQVDLTHDQRGLTRPVVFPALIHPFNGTDIGAVEVQQACPNGFIQSTPSTPCPPPTGGGGGPTATTPAATGQRADALKKCKKKKSKQKRKKCKKRANQLPV